MRRYSNPTPTTISGSSLLVAVLMVMAMLLATCSTGESNQTNASNQGNPTSAPPPGSTTTSISSPGSSSTAASVESSTSTANPDPTVAPEPDPEIVETTPPSSTTSTTPVRDCSPALPEGFSVTATNPLYTSIEVSEAVFPCAEEVGLAFATNPAAIASLSALDFQGPLLLVGQWFDDRLLNELVRLAPTRLITSGIDEALLRPALSDLGLDPVILDVATDPKNTVSFRNADYRQVWLVDHQEKVESLTAMAHQVGVGVIPVTGDLRALPEPYRSAIKGADTVESLSDFGEDHFWQLEVVRQTEEIPGGGLLMFDSGLDRRLVALYGHPITSALGVLGEQDAEQGIERLRSVSEGYEADGYVVLPTFEIIATVASAGAGGDGNYSNETARDVLRPWIETAADNGIYVVLDLQPGRTDFLSQAKLYEEFLRLPHVGLALDPEWRLKPDQVHLRQIGTVDASEVNQVVDWLAGIVREEVLPQKLLIVHQFRFSMITNRSQIKTPPELAVLIQMDGQGSLGSKYNTWNALTNEPDADQFHWGWKNFYDEDSPTPTPDIVLDLVPLPVFVSYQ